MDTRREGLPGRASDPVVTATVYDHRKVGSTRALRGCFVPTTNNRHGRRRIR
jgi:hypothetical protein